MSFHPFTKLLSLPPTGIICGGSTPSLFITFVLVPSKIMLGFSRRLEASSCDSTLRGGNRYSQRFLAIFRLARSGTRGGRRGPALSHASHTRFLRALPVIETPTSSDIQSSGIRCRGRCGLREHGKGGSTLCVRFL